MMILLRLIHILAGIFWVGTMFFLTFFLTPVIKSDPPTAGKVMQGLTARNFLQVVPGLALLSILSGLGLIWITSGGDMREYAESRSGHVFLTSGGIAIFAFLLGMTFARPAMMRAGQIGASMASVTDAAERTRLQAEMGALQQRNAQVTLVVVSLLILAAAGMAIARYV